MTFHPATQAKDEDLEDELDEIIICKNDMQYDCKESKVLKSKKIPLSKSRHLTKSSNSNMESSNSSKECSLAVAIPNNGQDMNRPLTTIQEARVESSPSYPKPCLVTMREIQMACQS